MSKLLASLVLGSLLFSACRKDETFTPPEMAAKTPCLIQKDNPSGRSYSQDSVLSFVCTSNYCSLMPLGSRNYWVYEDSIFIDGVFNRVQIDTLRYSQQFKSVEDGLVWWKGNLNIGLPETLFANDSSFFVMTPRLFTPGYLDIKKDYGMFPGDSVRYLTNFDDYAAIGRSLKLTAPFETAYGFYSGCLFFEKEARNYRKDQVIFQPGLGVVKYTRMKAGSGFPRVMKMQQVSTLVAAYFE